MRPGDRVELRDLRVAHYSNRQRYMLGGGEYTEHTFILTDANGRIFEYAGAVHLMRQVGDTVSLRATFANYKLISGRTGIRLVRPKLIGSEVAQLQLKW